MSKFTFEGAIEGISEPQKELICKVLEDRGFNGGTVIVSSVGSAGDNYVANVKRLAIEKDGETFKIIAKIAPTIEQFRLMMNTKLMFGNENVMYQKVLPKFTQMEKEANVPVEERLRYAECYGSSMEEPYEIILLEDLQLSNFVMLDRFKSLTDDTVKLILKNFAKLHSLSFALKDQEPETYERFTSLLSNMWESMQKQPDVDLYFEQLENELLELVQSDRGKQIIKGSMTKLPENTTKAAAILKTSKYGVIQQGDSWTNNIMFTLDGEKTVECCMIDYQISNHNSPVADLHYMIFNCTDYQTRTKHYQEWIDYYHNELEKRLADFGLTVNLAYPRDQLDLDLKTFGKASFGLCLMLATIIMKENSDAAKFKDAVSDNNMDALIETSKISNMNEVTLVRVKERLEGLVTSYDELGYIR